ncbi:hypothetical protein, partial [Pseudoalteromonas sp. SIMBA_162]|uniref:hypothetical protein n=1 Tax=Pseudoalteromonas sp. SIMBA_162 TaxID=3080867 RepID=UPI00397DB41B
MARKVKISCPRCEGKGVLPRYYYNRKGVCFLCWGAKVITVKATEDEKAKDVYERMKREEAEK